MRAAKNEVSFREANEQLEDKRSELELDGRTPFLCECGDPGCTELVRLSLEEYEHIRSHANWFLIAYPHHDGDDPVEEHSEYVVVEKHGLAGRIAKDEDPRG